MILSKETIPRKIKAGKALLFSAKECEDEEICITPKSFQNLLDTLGDYLSIQAQLATANERIKKQEGHVKHIADHYKRAKEMLGIWRTHIIEALDIDESDVWRLSATNSPKFFVKPKILSLRKELTTANDKNKRLREENESLNDLLSSRCVPASTPPIVCLCGSTRFMNAFFDAGWQYTLNGYIVLSVGVCKHADYHGGEALGQDVADKLDELHLRKIDLADSVCVLNVGGYIGESTRKEIEYAESIGKPIEYLEAGKIGEST